MIHSRKFQQVHCLFEYICDKGKIKSNRELLLHPIIIFLLNSKYCKNSTIFGHAHNPLMNKENREITYL